MNTLARKLFLKRSLGVERRKVASNNGSNGNRLMPPSPYAVPDPHTIISVAADAGIGEIPALSPEDQKALADFEARQQVLRDLTLGCITGNHTGAYIFGPPGVSKTFTVLKTLREEHANWRMHQKITAKPFYLEMEKHPGAQHVVDDCEQLFRENNALTLLRSALGGERM
jgi:hypothetical protein